MANDGLISAIMIDNKGGGRKVDWKEVNRWKPEDGLIWIHLDYNEKKTREWVQNHSKLEPLIQEALTAEETRPRCFSRQEGMLVILRGVNLNPGADPEDMVAIRAWIEPSRIITLRHRKVIAVDDIRVAIEGGLGPDNSGDFLVMLCDRLTQRMATVLSDIDDAVDELEDQVLEKESYQLRSSLGNLRREAIRLRRYLAPQREVMLRLFTEKAPWLDETDRARLREVGDRVTRYVEDLDSARDRAAVVREELESRIAEQMNKTMYILAILTGIFLPLGLLTGLLGINVGGIPGTENPYAFIVVCSLLVAFAIIQAWIFKRMKWI